MPFQQLIEINQNQLDDQKFQTLNESQMLLLEEVSKEYNAGFLALNQLPSKTVTFYGGSRIKIESESYLQTKNLARDFAKKGWGVVSGGGPGIMAASLEGAKIENGKSAGFRIDLYNEKPVILGDVDLLFKHFSVRKYMLRQSDVFVFAPGGIGTLDELMENLTLIATHKHPLKPIFLLDSKFWKGYFDWFKQILLRERQTINKDFFTSIKIVDTTQEVMAALYK
jgi:uncharacterized protein (TIGR00730 family)